LTENNWQYLYQLQSPFVNLLYWIQPLASSTHLWKGGNFVTIFTFNRLDWNIAYEGSWADKTLVDKEVELTIEIVVE
jgi:hypothetical protein